MARRAANALIGQLLFVRIFKAAGMPEVLATGYLVGIIEWACIESLHGHLDPDEISLGTYVNLTHQAPTTAGSTISIDVALTAVERRSLAFAVTARDEQTVISTGTHRRGVVNREHFTARLSATSKA